MDFLPPWYLCSFCKKVFQEKSAMIAHKREFHCIQMERRTKSQLYYEVKDASISSSDENDNEHEPNISVRKFASVNEVSGVDTNLKEDQNDESHGTDKMSMELENEITSSMTFWMDSNSTTDIIDLGGSDGDDDEPMTELPEVYDNHGPADEEKIDCHYDHFTGNSNECSSLNKHVNLDENSQMEISSESHQIMKKTGSSTSDRYLKGGEEINSKNEISPLEQLNKPVNLVTESSVESIVQIFQSASSKNENHETSNNSNGEENETTAAEVELWPVNKDLDQPGPVQSIGQFGKIRPPEKTFACSFCSKSFGWRQSLNFHHKTIHHHQNLDNSLQTKLMTLNQNFGQKFDIKEDERRTESRASIYQGSNSSVIRLCSQPAQNEQMENEGEVKMEEMTMFCCQICNKKFLTGNLLTEHLQLCTLIDRQVNKNLAIIAQQQQQANQAHSSSLPLPWSPWLGPPELTLLPKVQGPYRSETKQESKRNLPFGCKVCGRSFAKKWNLYAHYTIHTSRSPTCTICSRKFTREQNLSQHYAWHAKASWARVCKCRYCPRMYSNTLTLFQHQQLHDQNRHLAVDPTSDGMVNR